jgi:dCTP deaminase
MIDTGELKCILPDGETMQDVASHIVCASFDLRLGNEIKWFPKQEWVMLNPFTTDSKTVTEITHYKDDEDIIVYPWSFLLGATKERFGLPANIVGRVEEEAVLQDSDSSSTSLQDLSIQVSDEMVHRLSPSRSAISIPSL